MVPFFALFLNVVFQVVFFRFFCKNSFIRSILFGFLIGFVSLFILAIFLSEHFDICMVNALTYIFLSYGYFHFLNLGETARRIRLLRELLDSKDGLNQDEILQRYNASEIIDIRMKRLIENGQVVCLNNRYYIGKPFMLVAAKILLGLKALLLKQEFKR